MKSLRPWLFFVLSCAVFALTRDSEIVNKFREANIDHSDKVHEHHYELMYGPYIAKFLDAPFKMMEIGVERGRSLHLWQRIFPRIEHVYGLGYKDGVTLTDKKTVVDDIITQYYGDQSSLDDLKFIIDDIGREKLDVIIDDGSHVPWHQVFTFDILFGDLLAPGGVYIIEDIETSYWGEDSGLYGYKLQNAGFRQRGSAVEKFKSIIDVVNRKYFSDDNTFSVVGHRKTDHLVASIAFARNAIIIMKQDEDWAVANKQNGYYLYRSRKHAFANETLLHEARAPVTGMAQHGY